MKVCGAVYHSRNAQQILPLFEVLSEGSDLFFVHLIVSVYKLLCLAAPLLYLLVVLL